MKNAPNDTNFQSIQRVEIGDYSHNWQKKLRECVTDVDELFSMLELPDELKAGALAARHLFPLKVPQRYIGLIEKGNPHDPLLRQVLPLGEETAIAEGYSDDPLQELGQMTKPGVIQKYQGRVLLTLTGACAVHCRYCFRRQFPYQDANPSNKRWSNTLAHIAADTQINEVILSGGDPLLLSDTRLRDIVSDLSTLTHIRTLRIHSRVPIFLPERITEDLLSLLGNSSLKIVMVIHCNHAREIDEEVALALDMLTKAGVILLNQTVLLKGVNDNVTTLKELSQQLFQQGVMPYYLHLLDKVNGASHFDVVEQQAKSIYQQLLGELPGYLVPRLVRETPHATSKTPILP